MRASIIKEWLHFHPLGPTFHDKEDGRLPRFYKESFQHFALIISNLDQANLSHLLSFVPDISEIKGFINQGGWCSLALKGKNVTFIRPVDGVRPVGELWRQVRVCCIKYCRVCGSRGV